MDIVPDNVHRSQLRRVKQIRIVLPIILFLIVALYESWEHWVTQGTFGYDFHLTSEVLFFGVLGPTAVFIALTYIVALLEKQMSIGARLETLNRDLEQKVAARTRELAVRNTELANANEELQKLDQLKSDFVSLVSHELRGPLTTLNGGLELALQNAEQLPPEARRILTVMSRESRRLTEFVQTILDVSRFKAGKMVSTPGLVALLPLLRRVAEVICNSQDRPILWDVPSNLPPAWADEMYLEEIIGNLLSNADKYSPVGQPIEIAAHQENGVLQVTITDHGPGIPLEFQGKVFDRFRRVERGDRITTKGWGLGLYFARSLAEAQDSKVTLKSPVHDDREFPGSTFTVSIPIANEISEDA